MLFAGLLASGATSVTEPAPTRDHTERMLRQAGARVERDGAKVTVHPQDELEVDDIHVPGDPSSIAFHAAAAMLVPGSRLVLQDVGVNWTRVGFLRIAQRMGAVVVGPMEEPQDGIPAEEPIAELDVRDSPLGATVVEAEEVPLAIDDGSPGTRMSSTSSSSCGCTVTVAPSRSTCAPAWRSIRSV